MKKHMVILLLVLLMFSFTGCGRLIGTYRDSTKTQSLKFEEQHIVRIEAFGLYEYATYEIKGEKIIFTYDPDSFAPPGPKSDGVVLEKRFKEIGNTLIVGDVVFDRVNIYTEMMGETTESQ